jgi:hypothetical protein
MHVGRRENWSLAMNILYMCQCVRALNSNAEPWITAKSRVNHASNLDKAFGGSLLKCSDVPVNPVRFHVTLFSNGLHRCPLPSFSRELGFESDHRQQIISNISKQPGRKSSLWVFKGLVDGINVSNDLLRLRLN